MDSNQPDIDPSKKPFPDIDPSKKPFNEEPTPKKKFDDLGSLRFRSQKKDQPKSDDLVTFVKENTKDTIAYVLVIAGLLMMFFENTMMFGGFLVGVVLGLYFAKELAYLITNASQLIEQEGLAKSILFCAFLLVILIKAPFFFIGAALVALIRAFFVQSETKL